MITVTYVLGAAVIWVVLIGFTIKSLREWMEKRAQPPNLVPARVVRLYEEEQFIFQFGKTMVASHNAVFEIEDGRTMEFSLKPAEYRALAEGERGLLGLRGSDFAGFKAEE